MCGSKIAFEVTRLSSAFHTATPIFTVVLIYRKRHTLVESLLSMKLNFSRTKKKYPQASQNLSHTYG
jgi:hypothetical protein